MLMSILSNFTHSINNHSGKILAFGAIALGAYAIHASGYWEPSSCISRYRDCVSVQQHFDRSNGIQPSTEYEMCHIVSCSSAIIKNAQTKFLTGAAFIAGAAFYGAVSLTKRIIDRIDWIR